MADNAMVSILQKIRSSVFTEKNRREKLHNIPVFALCNSYCLTEKKLSPVSLFFLDYLLCLTRKAIFASLSLLSRILAKIPTFDFCNFLCPAYLFL